MAKKSRVGDLQIWQELGAATQETGIRAYKEARLIDLALIQPNPAQPRKSMDAEALRELAESIREQGLLQPLVVRPAGPEKFLIIAGHRRYEACKQLGMVQVPAIVRDVSDQAAREQAIIENIQRENLNLVEEAEYYHQLMTECGYSVRDMAAKVQKSIGYIHSRLALLKHADIAHQVSQEQVGVFEARELAKVEDQAVRETLTRQVAAGELDRETLRQEVKRLTAPPGQRPLFNPKTFSQHWERLRQELTTLEADRLAQEERVTTRQLLEGIKQTVEEMLARFQESDR